MHVVHLMASPFVGGPERQALGLAKALGPPYRTTFLSFAEGGRARALLDRARAEGSEAVELKENFPHLSRAVREVAGLLKYLRADLLCTSGYKPDLIGWRAARLAGVPVVAIAHGWTGATWRVRLYERLDALVMRWLDATVCVSAAMARTVRRRGVPQEKLVVIRNGIAPSAFAKADPDCRQRVRGFFPAPPALLVGAAGRLSPEKGFDVFVEASARVARTRPDVGFLLFGDGPLRNELARLIRERGLEGRFVLGGFRTDLEALVPGFDVAVLSSHTEGLPVAVLEASAAGLPVVATAVGGTPEVVEDGVTGLLAPPADPEALAQRLLVLLADEELRRRMGQAGWQRVRREFTFAAQAQRYRELFERLGRGRS